MNSKYVVKPGDTISKIIEKYSTSIKDLEINNDINNLKLIANQIILIPLPHNSSIKLYQIKTSNNDTINSILDKYSLSIDELKYFNNIYNLILDEKQEIEIVNIKSPGLYSEFESV